MSKFDGLIQAIRDGAIELAKDQMMEALEAAKSDASKFIQATEEQLGDWLENLAKGAISQKQFRSLVHGQKDLMDMFALTQAGIAATRIDRFRDALIDLVVSKAFSVLKIA